MKAITIKQPWAAQVAYHGKFCENRSWSSTHRGPLLIHAGQDFDNTAFELPSALAVAPGAEEREQRFGGLKKPKMQKYVDGVAPSSGWYGGAIIALADHVDVHDSNECCAPWGEDGWKHFVLENIRPIGPIVVGGKLMLWDVPPEVEQRVLAELSGMDSRPLPPS